MINKDDCLLFGTIGKPHGTKGAFVLVLRNIKVDEIKKRDSVFVEIDGLLVPFFIELFQASSNDAVLIKLEGISEQKAKAFAGLNIYGKREQVIMEKNAGIKPSELSGFDVYDISKGFVGKAVDIADISNNPLLIVQNGDQEILIPWHEDIIREIDDRKRKITIDAPIGLFEL
jgi:16S rRNA processing protein RimM